ncbi:NADP-dependent oxidoreductase [uncultured Microbacterium sp.]|uniref:NADP-dependent oxidoreductase n=1 Tax=uncultured Microbacterium sp. TaxID=191216 RepID=UPI0035CA7F1A
MSHAIVYTRFGGPEVLTLSEVPDPVAGEGEIVVRVEAAGVNPIDAKLRGGLRASDTIGEPRHVGSDAAGIVTAVGSGVDGFRAGDPVALKDVEGAYATDVVVAAKNAWIRPPGVSAAEGAALGIPVGTAYQTVRSLDVGPGDTLLVNGGSGAVGQAIVQFAVAWGATVVATASPRRFARIEALGAIPVAYGDGLADRVRAAAPGGVTVAIDAAGTDEAILTSIELVPDKSRIATIVRGRDAAGFGIRAFGGGSPIGLTPQQSAWRVEAVPVALALLAAGAFSIELGDTFPLAEASAAHRAVEEGANGKIILVP